MCRNRGPASTRRPSVVPAHSFSGLMRTSSSRASAPRRELITGAGLRSKPDGGVQRATKVPRRPGASANMAIAYRARRQHRTDLRTPRRGSVARPGATESHDNRLRSVLSSRKDHARPECPVHAVGALAKGAAAAIDGVGPGAPAGALVQRRVVSLHGRSVLPRSLGWPGMALPTEPSCPDPPEIKDRRCANRLDAAADH